MRLILVCLLACLASVRAVTPISGWNDGIATNYGGPYDGKNPNEPSWGTSVGSCGFGMLDKGAWPYWSVAAFSPSNKFYKAGPLGACGQCYEIKCIDKDGPWKGRCFTGSNQVSVVVQITDSCPECDADHIDIQALTFAKLAPMEMGRVHIQYRRVECVPPKKMVVYVDQAHGKDKWLRLFVEQAGGKAEVTKVQIRPANSQSGWIDLTNKWGSAWEMSNAPGFPLDVNIVGTDGDTVTAYGVLTDKGVGKMPTNVQFRITNPADSGLVNSINGGGGGMPAAYSGDKTPGAAPAPGGAPAPSSSSGSSSSGACDDIAPSSFWSCADQKKWGACDQWWMKQGGAGANGAKADKGYCRQTCGACSGGGASSGRRLAGVAV